MKFITTSPPIIFFAFCALCSVLFGNVLVATGESENPFTPKAYLLRYWSKQILTQNPSKSNFLLEKASPLSATEYAAFSKLASDSKSLSARLPDFCSKANLLCFPDLDQSLEKHPNNVNFATYANRNFTNYGTNKGGGKDTFALYSNDENVPIDSFRRYSRGSVGHDDKFSSYATSANVVDQSFNTYGTSATGGEGEFKNYNDQVNVPNLRFTSYSDSSNGRTQSFKEYTNEANAGDQRFTSYGKNGNGASNDFISYGQDSNVMGSTFGNYGETANGENDTFTSYGTNTNVPENNFNNYGTGGNSPVETFKNYRNQSNVGDDNFQTYGKGSNSAEIGFENYGQSFNEGTDKFSSYGKDAGSQSVGFKQYGVNNTFKEYAKEGVTFASYTNDTSGSSSGLTASLAKKVNTNRWVEPGKFFRESMLKKGTTMPFPDIRDKMPKRSFLPRSIVSKLPFSTSKIEELKKIFHAGEDDDSTMSKMIKDALNECERAPSPGETKRCIGSIEDMIDFSTSVLGRNIVVRTTENTQGHNSNIVLGEVKGINGAKVTKSVSCHQSLYPYLLYYCHSVPKVRVYEADIMDSKTKAKLNHGVAICHLDTWSWSEGHGAFVALGSKPGEIEVCHWIFENDMTWTVADD